MLLFNIDLQAPLSLGIRNAVWAGELAFRKFREGRGGFSTGQLSQRRERVENELKARGAATASHCASEKAGSRAETQRLNSVTRAA